MPQLNSGFVNDVHYMDVSGATGVVMTGNVTTSKSYAGMPGNPTGGFCLDKGQRYCIQASWTNNNTPTGTFTLQESNDNINWSTVSGSSQAIAGPVSGSTELSFMWKNWTDAKYVRVIYTRTSGGTGDFLVCTIRVTTRSPL